jgi:hypothetical protein
LYLGGTPLAENTTEEKIREKIDVSGRIYL